MRIDQSKVSLKERDIEDYLWSSPESLKWRPIELVKWLKRQYEVPSGILDLLGVAQDGNLVVVEVKNVSIDASALTQVSRYASDIQKIARKIYNKLCDDPYVCPQVKPVVVGRSIDHKTLTEADALGITVVTFEVELSLDVSVLAWTDEYLRNRNRKLDNMALDAELQDAVKDRISYMLNEEVPHDIQMLELIEQVEEALSENLADTAQ
jgi:predicted RecB family endonuclease